MESKKANKTHEEMGGILALAEVSIDQLRETTKDKAMEMLMQSQ